MPTILRVVVFLVLAVPALSWAQRKTPPPAYPAEIIGEEAFFHKGPSLDAAVLGLLPPGARVLASRKIYGEFAKFRRVKFRGKLGYVSVLDVEGPGGKRPTGVTFEGGVPAPRPDPASFEEESLFEDAPRFPSLFRNGAGAVFVLLWDRPHLLPGRRMDQWGAGLKLAGPDGFWKGPLAEFQLSFAVPKSASGPSDLKAYSLLADYNLLFPFYLKERWNVRLGVGPSVIFNSVQSELAGRDLNRWDVGLSLAPTVSMALGSFRVDAASRYHWTGAPFWSFLLSLEYMFPFNPPH